MRLPSFRSSAAALLVALAAVGIALACRGADMSLALMRRPLASVAVGTLAAVTLCALFVPFARKVPWRALHPAPLLLHAGFACVLVGWLVGLHASPEEGSLQLRAGETGAVEEDFLMTLADFSITHWEDTGSVRQYTSRVTVDGEPRTIDVNHPLRHRGWWVYQNSYQELENPHTGRPIRYTILLCVKDAGLPLVGLGGLLLLLGAACHLRRPGGAARAKVPVAAADGTRAPPVFHEHLVRTLYGAVWAGCVLMVVHRSFSTGHAPLQNMYEFLMCSTALLPILSFADLRSSRDPARRARTLLVDAFLEALLLMPVVFFMDGRVKHLMPALQSPFFIPHVGAYVLGYLVLVRAALGVGRPRVGLGFFLLTAGLVLGATWGKVCWGHWWQFDPKEMWSLATWFSYAAYFHVRAKLSPRGTRLFLAAGAVLILLTLTWINLSRLFTGMHSYA